MNLSLYIAKRYFFTRKKRNASNIITSISVAGFTIGSMALIIVLSAFNGFEVLVDSLYHSFYPDLRITAKKGKVFEAGAAELKKLRSMENVIFTGEVLEENVLLKYESKQSIATLKGVDEKYLEVSGMDSLVVQGSPFLEIGEIDYAIAGGGVAYKLSLNPHSEFEHLHVYVPKRGANPQLQPDKAFNRSNIQPGGIFAVEESIDDKYVFVPLRFAREVLDYPTQASAIEMSVHPEADLNKVQQQVKELMGENYYVKNRYEQNEVLYRIMKSEKLAVYLILTFILLIAAFNVTGSLYMLVIEKKADMEVLRSLGASDRLIQRIFLSEGLLVTLTGSILGIALGFVFCWLQQTYGFVTIGGSNTAVVNAYPVQMKPLDFVVVLLTSAVIGFITSYYPAAKATRLLK
ncbi:MAG: FtsX-like permease family protein [Bacteroidia bacterium]